MCWLLIYFEHLLILLILLLFLISVIIWTVLLKFSLKLFMANKWAFIINFLLLLELSGLDLDLYECEHLEIMDGGDSKGSPSMWLFKLSMYFPTLSWKHERHSSRTLLFLFKCSEHSFLCSPFFVFLISNERQMFSVKFLVLRIVCSIFFLIFFVLTVGSHYLLLLSAYQYI